MPLLPLPAVAGEVCAYTGRGRGLRLIDQWQVDPATADAIRSAATTQVDLGAVAACGVRPARMSYVVVLVDATGTARTFTTDGTVCDPVVAAVGTPPDVTPLGLARTPLIRLVERSRP